MPHRVAERRSKWVRFRLPCDSVPEFSCPLISGERRNDVIDGACVPALDCLVVSADEAG